MRKGDPRLHPYDRSRAYGCDVVELTAERRIAPIVRARQVVMYLAKVMGRSLPEIGRRFASCSALARTAINQKSC
jgi:chromosomal replication initiation ATPase DnaA